MANLRSAGMLSGSADPHCRLGNKHNQIICHSFIFIELLFDSQSFVGFFVDHTC